MSVPDSEALTPDDIFEILSNHRRRMVLYYLRKHDGAADVKELAEEIAALENEIEVEDLTSQQRKRVYVSLYQTHLPKMAQMNAIEYDKDAGSVQLSDRTDNIDRYLTSDEGVDYPWRFHYLAVSVIAATTLALSVFGAPFFASLSLAWIGVAVLSMFVVSVAVHLLYRDRDTDIPFELRQYDR